MNKTYIVADELRIGGAKHAALLDSARIEVGH